MTVADDVTLDVEEGEALGIIGPNGAGKSSLFNLITGNLPPDGGAIWLDGQDITAMPARKRVHGGLGRSYQIPQPFEHMTVFENISVTACFGANAREDAIKDHAVDILHRTGLLPKANLLSLLERKRLEMARALATKPRLLLLDEIAGGLTEAESHELIAAIHAIAADGVTIIWIEHVTHALLAVITRLIAIDFGKIISQGSPSTVITIEEGETIAMIGANGAGNSTFLSTLAGLRGATADMIVFDGRSISGARPADILKAGVALVLEGRKLFPSLSVEENLLVGNYGRKVRETWNLSAIYRLFPILKERKKQAPTSLSGGQQQMVALGRALMANPPLLLSDQISLGLAPAVIKDIYQALDQICAKGAAVIVVEQNIEQALSVTGRVYCLLEGRVPLEGRPADLDRERIRRAYFGG